MIQILAGDFFLMERAYQRLRLTLLEGILQEFNLDLMEGKEVTASKLLECCRLLPVMSPRRVVIVRNSEQIRKSEMDRLEPLLKEIPETTELILLAQKIDRRLGFWQKLLALGRLKEFRPLYPREVPRWIEEECRTRGVKIRTDAVEWLQERLGTDLSLISQAFDKTLLLKGKREEVTVTDLELVAPGYAFRSLFDLTDAIGSREVQRALRLFRQISSAGESPVGVVALIARHFRILLKVKETGSGAPPYFLKEYQRQAEGFSRERLLEGIEGIFKTDWALKQSPLSPVLLAERLIWELGSP